MKAALQAKGKHTVGETIITRSAEETVRFARTLGERLAPGTVISLRGALGSGKTVIAKALAEALSIPEPVTSPSYTLIQEYHSGRIPLIHIDLYRLGEIDEFELLGGEELLYGDTVTIIEWSELIDELLPSYTISIELRIRDDLSREITVSKEAWA